MDSKSHGEITKKFLSVVDAGVRQEILSNIAAHYGISSAEAYNEVVDCEAESLLDYVTGPERIATSVLMQRHGFAI